MAIDKAVDSGVLDGNLTSIAEACRKVKTKEDYDALVDMAVGSRKLTLPLTEILEGVTEIGAKAFQGTDLNGDIAFPEGLVSIRYEAFMKLPITSVTFPKSMRALGSELHDGWNFYDCSKLTTVTFQSTMNSMQSNSFLNCPKLTDIYVPWSEGEVANAPWGATSATIHYNWEVD